MFSKCIETLNTKYFLYFFRVDKQKTVLISSRLLWLIKMKLKQNQNWIWDFIFSFVCQFFNDHFHQQRLVMSEAQSYPKKRKSLNLNLTRDQQTATPALSSYTLLCLIAWTLSWNILSNNWNEDTILWELDIKDEKKWM